MQFFQPCIPHPVIKLRLASTYHDGACISQSHVQPGTGALKNDNCRDKLLRSMTKTQLVRSQLESGSSKPHVTSNNTCKSSSQKVENRRRFNVVSRPATAYAV